MNIADPIAIVDCDADPVTHETWLVKAHQKMGVVRLERREEDGEDDLYVSEEKVVLHRSEKQRGIVAGNKLHEELEGMKVLNANILDCLIENPKLYPESWKEDEEGNTLCIPYWGTVYLDFDMKPFVRCSYWKDGKAHSTCKWLHSAWDSTNPAAMLTS